MQIISSSHLVVFTMLVCGQACSNDHELLAADNSPNVIVIYTDDQGTLDTHAYGSKDLITPHMDELAKTGIRFTQMYAPSAICSSSRAGMLTGRFPARAGVPGNVSSEKGHAGMPSTEVTMAEMFKSAGYVTGHVGKWHLGYTPDTMPIGQGFKTSFGHMGGCIDNYSHFFYWKGPNRHDLWENGKEIWRDGKFFPDLMVEHCENFLTSNQKKPFFLYWAINIPHYPLQGTDKWRKPYEKLPAPRRMYAEFVSTMDDCIGKVVDKLDALGLRENTVIVLQSDHGHSTEVRTFGGGGYAGHFRGAKACLFEGGIRVPSIISCPGMIAQGEVRDQLVTGCDWFPTFAELCKLPSPKHHLDGKSIVPVLKSSDSKSPHDKFYWHLGSGNGAQWVVREGNWKLLGNPRDTSNKAPITKQDRLFLANLEKDVTESKNLAQEFPDVVQRLKQYQTQFVKSIATEK